MSRPPRVCAEPGCPNLTPCPRPEHRPRVMRSPSSKCTGRRDWTSRRERILLRDRGRCQWCGQPAAQVDHITPVSYGGGDRDGNLNSSCTRCNLERNQRAPRTGLALIATLGAPGSGKSTWARQQHGHHVLSLDALRPAGAWTFEKHRVGLTRLIKQATEHGLAQTGPLIIDTTGSTPALRGAIRHTADRIGYDLHGVMFDASLPTLIRRNRERHTPVPEEHLVRIATHLQQDQAIIASERWATLQSHVDLVDQRGGV